MLLAYALAPAHLALPAVLVTDDPAVEGVEAAPIQRYGKAHEPAPHLRAQPSDPIPPKIPHDPAQEAEEE